jgi:hypothetical protein
MMISGRFAIAAVLAAGVAACGSDAVPSGPTTHAVPPVMVLAGDTGAPVMSIVADVGATVVLNEPGFLRLETRNSGLPIYLWPAGGIAPLTYARFMVYANKDPGSLFQFVAGSACVVVDERITDQAARNAVLRGLDEVNDAQAGVVFHEACSAPDVTIVVDSRDPGFETFPDAAAVAYVSSTASFVIQSARVVAKDVRFLRYPQLTMHEFGHVLGFSHLDPDGPLGMLSSNPEVYELPGFTPAERLVMKLARLRPAGTRLASDTESTLAAAATRGGTTSRLACAFVAN